MSLLRLEHEPDRLGRRGREDLPRVWGYAFVN
jgi:hypothetical protein